MSLRYFGYLLITVGFLGGSFEVVKQVEGVNTAAFLVWLSIGIVGVIIALHLVAGKNRLIVGDECNDGHGVPRIS